MAIAIGVAIAGALKACGMTQRALADSVGVKESAISHYIKGDRTPHGTILSGIARTLGIPMSDLTENVVLPEDEEMDYNKIYTYLAVNGKKLSTEQKKNILSLLM